MNTPEIENRLLSSQTIDQLRADTPGCAYRIHLNNAGAGLMPRTVIDAIQDYLQLESRIGGYEAEEESAPELRAAYQSVASLVGAQVSNVAFVENATVAFSQALSSVRFKPGDVILTTANDYISNQIMFMSLTERLGTKTVIANDCASGGVDVDSLELMMDQFQPRLVSVTHVPTSSGLIQPVAEIGKLCRERDILYLVDACQSVGQMPIDVAKIQCDFLSATSRKFLRGPRGCGFLIVSDRVLERGLEPLYIDMRGAHWTDADRYESVATASRFENWEFAYALVVGTGVAAEYAMDLGLHQIRDRAFQLAAELRQQLSLLPGIRVLDEGHHKSAIVTLHIAGVDPNTVVGKLQNQQINTSLSKREYAVIDFDARNIDWALRVSPHYYNTEQEIETAINAIADMSRVT